MSVFVFVGWHQQVCTRYKDWPRFDIACMMSWSRDLFGPHIDKLEWNHSWYVRRVVLYQVVTCDEPSSPPVVTSDKHFLMKRSALSCPWIVMLWNNCFMEVFNWFDNIVSLLLIISRYIKGLILPCSLRKAVPMTCDHYPRPRCLCLLLRVNHYSDALTFPACKQVYKRFFHLTYSGELRHQMLVHGECLARLTYYDDEMSGIGVWPVFTWRHGCVQWRQQCCCRKS